MTKILIHEPRGGLQCNYVTSISDIVGGRGGIGVDIYPFVSHVNHAEHGKTWKTWLGDDDNTEGLCPLRHCPFVFVLACMWAFGCFPFYLSIDLIVTIQADLDTCERCRRHACYQSRTTSDKIFSVALVDGLIKFIMIQSLWKYCALIKGFYCISELLLYLPTHD